MPEVEVVKRAADAHVRKASRRHAPRCDRRRIARQPRARRQSNKGEVAEPKGRTPLIERFQGVFGSGFAEQRLDVRRAGPDVVAVARKQNARVQHRSTRCEALVAEAQLGGDGLDAECLPIAD